MGLQYEFLADPATIIISCAVFMVYVLFIHNTIVQFWVVSTPGNKHVFCQYVLNIVNCIISIFPRIYSKCGGQED